jgi:hypothetical protein
MSEPIFKTIDGNAFVWILNNGNAVLLDKGEQPKPDEVGINLLLLLKWIPVDLERISDTYNYDQNYPFPFEEGDAPIFDRMQD